MEAGFLEVARLNPYSVMIEQVNVFAIEVERYAIGDTKPLESFDGHAQPVSGRSETVELRYVAKVLDSFERNRGDTVSVLTH